MKVLKCDICGKIFEYKPAFVNLNYTVNGVPATERLFNKIEFYNIPRPIKDQYDDGDLITLSSYDICSSCASRLAEFICKEKEHHESTNKSDA